MISILAFLDKWSLEERSACLQHVGTCLEKGFTLNEAFLLQKAEARPIIKKQINGLLSALEDGHPLAKVLADFGFPQDITAFLHFSSQTGSLSKGFQETGHLLLNKCNRRKRVRQLLRYPIFLVWILIMMGTIILRNLLPNFEKLYSSMSITLPPLSRSLLSIAAHSRFLATLLGLSLLIGVLSYIGWRQAVPYETRLKLSLRLPFLSPFIKLSLTSTFSTQFGSLLKIGMAENEALDVMANQSFHPFLKNEAIAIKQGLTEGLPLSTVFSNRSYYTKDLPTVVINGSQSGRLGETLVNYSHLLFKKLETKINQSLLMIQPVFFILIGGFILIMFLSMLLPMFDIMKGL